MAKNTNKKKAKKGSVRRTIGALFMATAVLVAAIPVENLGAAESTGPTELKVTVDVNNCRIPVVDDDETIYTTGDGRFQFAYVSTNDDSSINKVAVILGYDGRPLEDGRLVIPDTVDAYLKYSHNEGSGVGYCAVSKDGHFLFYETKVQAIDENGNLMFEDDTTKPIYDKDGTPAKDENGKPLFEQKAVMVSKFEPCYYSDIEQWRDLKMDQFYYQISNDPEKKDNKDNYALTKNANQQHIKGATVRYIGNQYLKAGEDDGTWTIAGLVTESKNGIFNGTKASNIVSLVVGKELSGVGNYAFYGCSNLSSITLGNGLDTIGNYAFAECINISRVNVDINAMIKVIGDHAFYNCDALTEFTMPISVTRVGDYAFANCDDLVHVELCGEGKNVALTELGYNVFQNCPSLASLEFPKSYSEEVQIGMFAGCTSLKFIRANNRNLNFVDTKDFTIEDFKKTVPKEFYFEGWVDTPLYKTASEHFIAFKYHDEDIYEIIVEDSEGHKAVYQVNSKNQLLKCEIPEGMKKAEIPETIGPCTIQNIWGTSFRNNCSLEEVVIPSSVLEIESGAFKGCHKLKAVYFTEPIHLKSIGDAAFQTQDRSGSGHENCGEPVSKPSLYFVGPIDKDCAPFQYAMKEVNKLNVLDQQRAYITYCSGWPTLLEVEYDPNTKLSTLTGYPTFKQIQANDFMANHPYLGAEYGTAAAQAVQKFLNGEYMTDGEKEIVNAALALEIPYGVEAIREGLFTKNEGDEEFSDKIKKTVSIYGVKEIKQGLFKDCTNFTGIHIMDTAEKIESGAFEGCSNLTDVTVSNTVSELGLLPFYGCDKLNYVNFMNSPYFSCPSSESAMIFQLDESGQPYKLVEVLQGRTKRKVTAEELQGIKELGEGAFKGTGVDTVDMTQSMIKVIPTDAFADTARLHTVDFPNTWTRVDKDAFKNSAVVYLTIPGEGGIIAPDAFTGCNLDGEMTFYCVPGGAAEDYAIVHGIKYEKIENKIYYNVKFYDFEGNLLKEDYVLAGTSAEPPEPPFREGYIFKNWTFDTENIQKDMEFKAYYEADSEYNTVVITFYDYDGTQLGEPYRVPIGSDMTHVPDPPAREGYRFIGWSVPLTNVQTDLNPHALYEPVDGKFVVRFLDEDEKTVLYSITVNPGEDCVMPVPPTKPGKTFVKWSPSPTNVTRDMDVIAIYEDERGQTNTPGSGGNGSGGNGSGSGDGSGGNGSGSGDGQTNSKLYTLTVKNGLGTGSYVAGTPVVVKAQEAGSNMEFVNWTVEPADVTVTDKNVSAIIVTMPASDVTITANFRTKSGSGGSSGNGSGNGSGGSGANRPNGGSTGTSGTTVVIDKNGISNTGVVSAVVNGSSDNFTIKIREDANASELALRALKAEYGEDLTGIKYFPMDISLYDSTGKNMITDTTGLSIKITLPLPDSLIAYAGNNKVASVSSGKLEKLQPTFTTISGVSCITFTAEHFSPYVIYVDTRNLSAGSVQDSTPKTGDRIHPKWFLSIGLACVSIFLFLKKDKQPKKVPVRVKAGNR